MQNSLIKNLYVQPRKSTVILSSNDVITCYDILDVTNDVQNPNIISTVLLSFIVLINQ